MKQECPGMGIRVHILDTSALSDLAEHSQYALARHKLLDGVAAGRMLVLGTAPLLWELAGLHALDPALLRASMDLLIRITGSRMILATPTRQVEELRSKGALPYPGFVDPDHTIVPMEDREALAHAAAVNEGRVRGLRFHEAEQAQDTADALDEETRRQANEKGEEYDPKAWHRALKKVPASFWYEQAEHNARVQMDRVAANAGVSTSGVSHRDLPSFWASALIHAARIRAVLVGRTNPAGRRAVGRLDLLHLSEAAAYADVFVTSDRRLRVFAPSVLNLRCEVLSLEAWVARLTA
jgi:hypothetical protein